MKKYIRFIGIVILCVILLEIDLTKLQSIFSKLNMPLFVIAILLNIPLIFLKSIRWNQLLKSQSVQFNFKDSFLIYLSGIYMGIITPGRFGDFIKAFYLRADKGMSLSMSMSSVIVDRLFDMYLLIILGIAGIWKFKVFGSVSNMFLLIIIVVVLAPLFLLNKNTMKKFLNSLYNLTVINKIKIDIKEGYNDFYHGINQLINYKLVWLVLITCLSYILFFSQCYILANALGITVDFVTITLFMAISNLISFIPISVSGLGTRDAILIYLFSLIGLKSELAVSYAFLVFITFFVCVGIAGAIAWWIKPLPKYSTHSNLDGTI